MGFKLLNGIVRFSSKIIQVKKYKFFLSTKRRNVSGVTNNECFGKHKFSFVFILFNFLVFNSVTFAAGQRELLNTGFEDITVPVNQGGPNTFVITSDANVSGWISTNGDIEIWTDGFQNKASSSGNFFAEMNPSVPVNLFQEVCLVNGETLSWEFDHSARTSDANTPDQTLRYEVDFGTGTQVLQSSTVVPIFTGTNNDNSDNNWFTRSGSAVYTGPTGIHRIQFATDDPGSLGNHLDNIVINLVPTLGGDGVNTIEFENVSTNTPQIVAIGLVQSPITVTFSVDPASTATLGADYTLPANSIVIPSGNYDGVSADSFFPIPINIIQDSNVGESDETIIFNFDSAFTGFPQFDPILGDPCNGIFGLPQLTHTILDFSPSLDITKAAATLDNDADNTGAVSEGDTLQYIVTATNDGNVDQNNVVVSDAQLTPNSFTCATLAPNANCVLTGTHVVTAAEASAGEVVNTAGVVSDEILAEVPSNTVTTPVIPLTADIFVTKDLVTAGPFTSGQTITYNIVVGNSSTSQGSATNVVITDIPTNLTITSVSSTNCNSLPCTIPMLAVGATEVITVQATTP